MFEDNQGAIALARNPIHHSRAKHIDVHHLFVQERIERGELQAVYVNTKDQLADILTKGLKDAQQHERLTGLLGLADSTQAE